MQAQASVSYVTGSHALKAGFDLLQGTHTNPWTGNADALRYRFNNAVPNQLTESISPWYHLEQPLMLCLLIGALL